MSRFQRLTTAPIANMVLLGLLAATFGATACGDDAAPASGSPDAGDCWYCADASQTEAATPAKDGGDGKSIAILSGEINRTNKTGKFVYSSYATGKTPDCTVTYAVQDVTDDASCTSCTFAHRFALGAATTQGTGCTAGEGFTGTTRAYGHGPGAKGGNGLYAEITGAWKEIGSSALNGDVWTFEDLSGLYGAGKPIDGGKSDDAGDM